MNFTNLYYFLVLAKELNFTKTASKLYISQQSLSAHIAKLEKYFNVSLFDRTPPLKLTPAGKYLYEKASEIFEIKSTLEKEMERIKNNLSGEISIGATISRGPLLLPKILKKYSSEFPNTKINILQQDSSIKLENSLLEGKVDLIIGFTPRNDNAAFESIFLYPENFVMIIPKVILDKYFSKNKDFIIKNAVKDLKLIKECPFIKIDSNKYAGIIFDGVFSSQGVTPNIYATVSNIETMMSLCFAGLGIIIVPQIFINSSMRNNFCFNKDEYCILPVEILNNNTSISVTYLRKKKLSSECLEFIKVIKEIVRNS